MTAVASSFETLLANISTVEVRRKLESAAKMTFTDAQWSVLSHLVVGHSAPSLARMRGRSLNTVHDHIKSLYKKTGCHDRVQLTLWFFTSAGMLTIPPTV